MENIPCCLCCEAQKLRGNVEASPSLTLPTPVKSIKPIPIKSPPVLGCTDMSRDVWEGSEAPHGANEPGLRDEEHGTSKHAAHLSRVGLPESSPYAGLMVLAFMKTHNPQSDYMKVLY